MYEKIRAFISIASFASSDLEATLSELADRSFYQSPHLNQSEVVQEGDVQPIETWLANWQDRAEDFFGSFLVDGDASSGASSTSPFNDAFSDQLPAHAEFDTNGWLKAGDATNSWSAAGDPSPTFATLSSPTDSSIWVAAFAAPHDDGEGLPNSHTVLNGFYISERGYGSFSWYGQDAPTHADLELVSSDSPLTVVGVPSAPSSHFAAAQSPSAIGATGSSGINITNATANANGSTTETVTFAGSGIVFNDTFDPSVSQAYKNCILSAEQTIATEWTNSVTINEEFSAQAQGLNGELASNQFYVYGVSYATLKGALVTLAAQEPNNAYLQQAVSHLPSTDPSAGAGFELTLPYARMLGLTSTTQNPDDIVTLNTSYNWSYGQDVINTVEHEMSEGGMGRIGGLGDQNGFWSVMDLFRYNSSGTADYNDGRDGQTTYFSYNGGATLSSLSFNNEFNSSGQQVNNGDTADFVQQDVFGTGTPGETNTLSQTDLQVMEALGWDPGPAAPVVRATNQTVAAGQSVPLSSIFSVSGSGITAYRIWFSWPEGGDPADGTVTNNGTPIALDQWDTVSSLSGLAFVGAVTPGTDHIWLQAYNGSWSNSSQVTITEPSVPAPMITAINQTVAAGQSIPLSSIFSTSGSGITAYRIWFSWPEGGDPADGTVTNNGTPIALDQWDTVSSLSGLAFVGAVTPGTDHIWLQAYNGSWSNSSQVTITEPGVPAPAAPVVTATNQTVAAGQSVPLSSIYSVSGSGITAYRIWFSWPEGGDPADGTVTNNGTPIALDQWDTVSSLSGLAFVGAVTPGTDHIWLQAYNGSWSNSSQVTITEPSVPAPMITAINQTVAAGQSIPLSSIFSVSGSGITAYRIWFSWPDGGDPADGTVTNNGTPIAADQWDTVSSLSGLAFVGSVTPGTDHIWLQAYNGSWSNSSQATIADYGSSPMRASGFLSTLGVGTHIPYTDSAYVNLGNVVADLRYLGITQIRDSLSDGSNGGAPLSSDIYLAQQGIKFTALVETSTTAGLNYALSLINQLNEAVPGSITAVEGPNEINNFPLTFNGVSGLQGAIDLQKALYADVHSDPNLAGVPVDYFTGYDAGSISTGPNPATTAGLADYDTQHPYPTYGQAPAWFVSPSNSLLNEGPAYGPAVYTETGYSTNGGSGSGLVPVNQDVQAKYTLDLLMDAAKDGISKTDLYQLMDGYQPGSPQGDDGFGLFDPNNVPKEAATAIHNLTTILADNGAGSTTFTTTPLNYSVSGLPTTGNNMSLEKSNGAYDIVVWNEPEIWNESTATEIAAPTVNVNVELGRTYSEVDVFDPLVSSTPIQTLTQVSSVQLGINDHPLIVEVEPNPNLTAQTADQSQSTNFDAGYETLNNTAAPCNGARLPSRLAFNAATETSTGTAPNSPANLNMNAFATNASRQTMAESFSNATAAGPGTNTTAVIADHDSNAFLFHPNLGQTASTDRVFGTDTVHIGQAEFASGSLPSVHEPYENICIADTAHDTVTLNDRAIAQQHHSAFLI